MRYWLWSYLILPKSNSFSWMLVGDVKSWIMRRKACIAASYLHAMWCFSAIKTDFCIYICKHSEVVGAIHILGIHILEMETLGRGPQSTILVLKAFVKFPSEIERHAAILFWVLKDQLWTILQYAFTLPCDAFTPIKLICQNSSHDTSYRCYTYFRYWNFRYKST